MKATGPYCAQPGARLYFRENPTYGTLPSAGNICVNQRWHAIPSGIVTVNLAAHQAISAYLAKSGGKSPWLYYKLVNVQATPVDVTAMNNPRFSTTESYYMANSVIETDYSLGEFTGDLVNGAPSNVVKNGGLITPYYNVRLLLFPGRQRLDLAGAAFAGWADARDVMASPASEGQGDLSFCVGQQRREAGIHRCLQARQTVPRIFPLQAVKAH